MYPYISEWIKIKLYNIRINPDSESPRHTSPSPSPSVQAAPPATLAISARISSSAAERALPSSYFLCAFASAIIVLASVSFSKRGSLIGSKHLLKLRLLLE